MTTPTPPISMCTGSSTIAVSACHDTSVELSRVTMPLRLPVIRGLPLCGGAVPKLAYCPVDRTFDRGRNISGGSRSGTEPAFAAMSGDQSDCISRRNNRGPDADVVLPSRKSIANRPQHNSPLLDKRAAGSVRTKSAAMLSSYRWALPARAVQPQRRCHEFLSRRSSRCVRGVSCSSCLL